MAVIVIFLRRCSCHIWYSTRWYSFLSSTHYYTALHLLNSFQVPFLLFGQPTFLKTQCHYQLVIFQLPICRKTVLAYLQSTTVVADNFLVRQVGSECYSRRAIGSECECPQEQPLAICTSGHKCLRANVNY